MGQFWTFAGIEMRYHLRNPVNYIFMFLMLFGGWLYTATSIAWAGPFGGAIHNNAPSKLNVIIMFMTLFGTVFTPAIAGTALLRDFEFRTHELLFTTRLRKSSFVFGRFVGAALVTTLVVGCTALGLWLGVHMPWSDPDKLGPEYAGLYLWPVLVYVVPNAILTCALFVAVGVLTRSFLAVYVQGMVMFVGYQLAMSLLGGAIRFPSTYVERLVALVDPFGISATRLLTRHWTIDEQNSRLIEVTGLLLWNRLLWLAVAALVLLVAYRLFRMEAFPGVRRRARAVDEPIADPYAMLLPIPPVTPRSGRAAAWSAFTAMTRLYFYDVVRARPFRAIVVILLVFMLHIAELNFHQMTTLPVTWAVLLTLEEYGVLFSILLGVYAGQLVWRERGLGCDQIHDATQVSSVAVIAAKTTALVLVHVVLLTVLLGFGLLFQALAGYTNFELPVYLGHLHGLDLARHALTIFLAVALQLLVPHRALGIALLIGYFVVFDWLTDLGIEHRLLRYADLPKILYSDMNGFGPNVWMFVVLFAYYAAFALLLLALGRLLHVRGTPNGLRARLRAAGARVTGRWSTFVGLVAAVWLGLGAYIAHNVHVRNTYLTERMAEQVRADHERNYKQYETLPQPRITAADLHADLSPETAQARIRGTYRLDNPYETAIDTVHLYIPEELTIHALVFVGGAVLEQEDPRTRYQIWRLAAPLPPGGVTALTFDLGAERTGFAHKDRTTEIFANGALLSHEKFLPMIGYRREIELEGSDERKRVGLPARDRMLPIGDPNAPGGPVVRHIDSWIDLSTTVCTAPDQIAVASGSLVREWQQDGRRCFKYVVDAKSPPAWTVSSARYEVVRDRHAGIDLEIYHHPPHTYVLARMFAAMKRSLDYYQANFTPYQYRQVRIVEFPRGDRIYARAFPGTAPFSEALGFILKFDPDDRRSFDYPFMVTAHEVAHQWWGYQVSTQGVQGATMVIESLAEYSALQVLKQEYGLDGLRSALRLSLDEYLRGRAQERVREVPLARCEHQEYIRYAKGGLVLYGLADLIGEDVVNGALARFARTYGFKGPPLPTADDVVAILREVTPPQYQYFITDGFETITLYDNKICEASVAEEGGHFRVRFKVCARKVRADELGRETPTPMADHVDIGVFAAPGEQEFLLGKPLLLEKRLLTSKSADDPSAELEVEVVVDERPGIVGVDPYRKLIDSRPHDNIMPL
ncbi:ABC transporter permease/M1 family aminopeptidase [Nannocystis radixulma]|uniref:Peptidase M1 membrane alanine aminopeptidase domain-containing protein n=1 Tax=Nannocystis radixulma TaxID=2995305 RepID=A0ABT5BG40_9BACT|nr:hypothetical protein [Nannocystis radixulma]MDC0672580.1 hypothetical protein [Nannocystis radixulma]